MLCKQVGIISRLIAFRDLRILGRIKEVVLSLEKVSCDLEEHSRSVFKDLTVTKSKIDTLEKEVEGGGSSVKEALEALKKAEKHYEEVRRKVVSVELLDKGIQAKLSKSLEILRRAQDNYKKAVVEMTGSKLVRIGKDTYMFKKVDSK